MKFIKIAVVFSALMSFVSNAALITEIKDIAVGSDLYTVTFSEGSCNTLYTNCSSFPFNGLGIDINDAIAGLSTKLQILLDADATLAKNISGCDTQNTNSNACWIRTAYGEANNRALIGLVKIAGGSITTETDDVGKALDSSASGFGLISNWAEWTKQDVPAIPEPATFAIFALALAGLVTRRIKQ